MPPLTTRLAEQQPPSSTCGPARQPACERGPPDAWHLLVTPEGQASPDALRPPRQPSWSPVLPHLLDITQKRALGSLSVYYLVYVQYSIKYAHCEQPETAAQETPPGHIPLCTVPSAETKTRA
jgi:hypothetical protein